MAKSDFRFMTKIRVRWMECDGQGIVYNGAYLDYLEIGQAEYYRNLGFAIYIIPQSGYFDFVVVKSTQEFKAPAKVDEIIELHVRVSNIGNTSLTLNLEIYAEGSDRLLTSIETVYVGYDTATESTRPVPDAIRELVTHFEETGEVLPIEQFPELAEATSFNQK
ncbi:MAG: acyl-CoA thioesterase [SAR202 cluster bacterium]|uniref:4-hydroxybenzoyl-CoA thioesterase family active site n=1 Tax=hydrothermal vent metagenome TaxID=652676 RepID=A0A160V9Z9_9ZZZZ|nr:acyl-CoA thioesterase [Dehalococcoidia bacterium]MEC9289978.1 thioesterase family protein [Chloroflexota bacterium]MQF92495.1 acyl-CoA thioesterase [SAR202 cluster bacterium]MQG15058.1 acyl-CoA thioesterase [SAR202 cluster bacterium]MQG63556.1 acyl-CoA thioesterase [SAR202 cluster bacterium]|tara:strand:+ start:2536 stop:3027 length:492 start_codon:yes stop_codon:yes gene_type:complete